jgi:recombination DNA repair RAD52 pathway protein
MQHELFPLSPEQIAKLRDRLNDARVANRSQGGAQLSYLETYDVKATLVRIFGFGGFSADVIETKILRMDKDAPAMQGSGENRTQRVDWAGNPIFNWSVTAICTMRLHIHQLGATYTESAVSAQVNPDPGEAADFAVKTAESDALKRAATYLGTQFGLSLYNSGSLADVIGAVVLAPGYEESNAQRAAQRRGVATSTADVEAQIARATSGQSVPDGDGTATA